MNFQYTYQIPIWLLLQGFCLLLTIFSAVWLMNVIVLMETRPVIGRREHKGAVSIVFRVLFLVLLLQGLGGLAFPSSIASFHVSIHLASYCTSHGVSKWLFLFTVRTNNDGNKTVWQRPSTHFSFDAKLRWFIYNMAKGTWFAPIWIQIWIIFTQNNCVK